MRLRWGLLLAATLACASAPTDAPPRAPDAPAPESGELLDCSYEYSALSAPESYVRAINDVAGSYLAARNVYQRELNDPDATEATRLEAWKAQVAAAQALLRACRCWEQLDRLGYPEQVLAAEEMSVGQLKAEVGEYVAVPCQNVFDAEAAGR